MRSTRFTALIVLMMTVTTDYAAQTQTTPPDLVSWEDVQAQSLPPPGEKIAYGSAPQQFGELRLPQGKEPHPIVVLIHGGCWLGQFDYTYMTHLAAALTHAGYATWIIEYRRLGDAGGGWPNTFLDVAQSVDLLRSMATRYPLDLHHLIAVGHSSGGQLALWLASRHHTPTGSPLYNLAPVEISGVIGLAAITDLAQYRIGPEQSCHGAVEPLMGGAPSQVPIRYADVSPMALLPLSVPQVLIQGDFDDVVPPPSAENYVTAAKRSGDNATLKREPLGHFDLVLAKGPSYDGILAALESMTNAASAH